ncbi:hypothetical protein KIPB_003926, partial [Kipferlia bialata]
CVTYWEVFQSTDWTLAARLDCSVRKARKLKSALSELFLRIYELSGEAAACKTQIVCSLLVRAQLPVSRGGLGGSALIVYTEGSFPAERTMQVARGLGTGMDPMANLLVKPAITAEDLHATMVTGLGQVLSSSFNNPAQLPVRLVIIDSLAAPLRTRYDRDEMGERQTIIEDIFSAIRLQMRSHAFVCLITNQVTDLFDPEPEYAARLLEMAADNVFPGVDPHNAPGDPRDKVLSSGRYMTPALGATLSKHYDTRLMAAKGRPVMNTGALTTRSLHLLWDRERDLTPGKVSFVVTESGVVGVEE